MPKKNKWKAKITTVSKPNIHGDAVIYYDIYKNKKKLIEKLKITGRYKVSIYDTIRKTLKKHKQYNENTVDIEPGDEIELEEDK